MPSGTKAIDQVADSIAKFYDRQIKPPRGGWHFPLPRGVLIEKHSESDVIGEVKRWRKNNGTFVSDLDVEREVWNYYCNREPKRCKGAAADSAPRISAGATVIPAEVTKELQGPPIWLFLNTLAVRWEPTLHDYFLHTIDAISVILECPICREEWRSLQTKRPATNISSKLEACQWVNAVHNEVNARIGKQAYPYSRMISEFGAPPA